MKALEDIRASLRSLERALLEAEREAEYGGPEYGDPQDAEKWVGFYTAKQWAHLARSGRIAGARKQGKRWCLPLAACRSILLRPVHPSRESKSRGPRQDRGQARTAA